MKILLMAAVLLLPFANAVAATGKYPLPPVPDNSFYSYEAPATAPSPPARQLPVARARENLEPVQPGPGENINFLDGLTARKQGDVTYFSTGVVCQEKDDIAVCR